jgi:p-aminobenzoyl-glutamate transporter AbgT
MARAQVVPNYQSNILLTFLATLVAVFIAVPLTVIVVTAIILPRLKININSGYNHTNADGGTCFVISCR